jgi:glycolate oxidase iron-sulfur subunit
MRSVVEGRTAPDDPAFATHIDRCLGCRACEPVCPSGVQYGFLLERARATIAQVKTPDALSRLLLATFANPIAAQISGALGRLFRATGLPTWLARHLPEKFGRIRFALAMLSATRAQPVLPAVAVDPRSSVAVAVDPGPSKHRVALLRGCVQDAFFRHVNEATERVLRANGCDIVDVPGQTCCGALHAHSGALHGAEALARQNLKAFERSGADYIIVNAAGCGAMMKEYGKHFERDAVLAARAAALSSRVRDLFQFLAEIGPAPGAPLPLTAAYDAPCHLHHGQGVTRAPLDAMRAIPGLRVVPVQGYEECCGGAGIYGLTHPDLGGRILHDKVEAVRATGAAVVITPNPGCIMQIGAGLRLAGLDTPELHPIELLDESYRRLETSHAR